MASLVEVKLAIANTVKNATGLRPFGYVPDDVDPPAAIVTLQEAEIQTFKLGQYDLPMRVTVITSTAEARAGQLELDSYVDFEAETSVWRAIFNNRKLGFGDSGGVDCAVKRYEPLGIIQLGTTNYYAGAFDLTVLVSPITGVT